MAAKDYSKRSLRTFLSGKRCPKGVVNNFSSMGEVRGTFVIDDLEELYYHIARGSGTEDYCIVERLTKWFRLCFDFEVDYGWEEYLTPKGTCWPLWKKFLESILRV